MKKNLVFFGFLIILITFCYLYLGKKGVSVGQYSEQIRTSAEESTGDVISENSTKDSSIKEKPREQGVLLISKKNNWLRDHGFTYLFNTDGSVSHIKAPLSDYDVYKSEDLSRMAINDAKAALVLGSRLVKNRSHIEAYPYLYKAAVWGYARGLTDLSDSLLSQAKTLDRNKNLKGANKKFVEAFAWGQVLNLRFRPDAEPEVGRRVSIDPARLKQIKESARSRAKEMYQELKAARKELGLDEFDNYMPEGFKLLK